MTVAAAWLAARAPRCLLCAIGGRPLAATCAICNPPSRDRYRWVLGWEVETELRLRGRAPDGRPYTPIELAQLRANGWIIPLLPGEAIAI